MRHVGSIVLINSILVTVVQTLTMMSTFDIESGCTMTTRLAMNEPHRFRRLTEQYVPYTETYRARAWGIFIKTKSRTNYKIQHNWVTEKTCCYGWTVQDTACVPVCLISCVNAKCVRPNTCECKQGFTYTANQEKYVCEPVCEGNCTNGVCVSPDHCECDRGYELSTDRLHCLPICQQNCEQRNARCVGPDTCACQPGYQSGSDQDPDFCAPKCERICSNGNCTAPNTCTCDPGYRQDNNTNDCQPICSESCANGSCVAPEVCNCDPGYQLLADSKYVCEPACEDACVNGNCTAPNVCSCHDGYKLNEDEDATMRRECEPICEKPCGNGTCIAPGVCNCTEDYWFKEEEQTCVPSCKIPCEPHGVCSAPDTCSCFDGYRMIDTTVKQHEVSKIVTIFQPESEFLPLPTGKAAYAGASDNITDEYTSACEPVCEPSCKHGKCTAPNFCSCIGNHRQTVDGRCTPICPSCENGVCVEPGVCQCLQGFVRRSESRCVPFCENGCENGECIAPNECRCNAGFETNANHTCVKPCTRVCKGHATCVEDTCECSYGWAGRDCDQPTVCILRKDLNNTNLDGLAVHNETNSTLMNAKRYAPDCYQCNETASNKSLCFVITFNDSLSTLGCFVERESPCYPSPYHSSTDSAVSRMAGTFAAVTILIMAATTTALYFVIRRHRRGKMHAATMQTALYPKAITHEANECLISEEESHDALLTLSLNDIGIN
ncbi:unnamed protein product [Heterotrigona itama]|uniref:EGF-like domain-containing protein n=1 Tax=Heterotrigona itama TaxID=395501 RepID=A0A6V7H2Y9_9HYME|nr:unnamed protein product [Heterotrigona itama]